MSCYISVDHHEIIHLKTCAKYFEKTNISYPSYAHYVCVSGCKKYWFFGKCFVRNKWMIPSFIYRVGNSCMLQFSNQSSIPIYPENISKTSGFLMISGGVETEHWPKMRHGMVNIVTEWIINKFPIHSISVCFELTTGGLK